MVNRFVCTGGFLIRYSNGLTFMGSCIVNIFQYISDKMQLIQFIYIWKLLYMFRVVSPPIIRSSYNCIYSIWYLSHCYCYLPLSWKSWNVIRDAVYTVVCAPDCGWSYQPKHVEQFPDINKLYKVAACWIYIATHSNGHTNISPRRLFLAKLYSLH